MKYKRLLALLLALLLLTGAAASADNAQADLQARFGGQATWKYEDKYYCVKKRLSTMLAAVCQDDELLLAYLITVDDNARRIVPIALDVQAALLPAEGDTLARFYGCHPAPSDPALSQADSDAQRLLAAVNSLFPEPLIESYLLVHAEGLALLDGGGSPDPALTPVENIKARIKAIGKEAMAASGSEQMDMFSAMGPYLVTDVKSGAMMKIADKATRYEVLSSQPLPADADQRPNLIVEYFYDETTW